MDFVLNIAAPGVAGDEINAGFTQDTCAAMDPDLA